jgi:hypothetical protein
MVMENGALTEPLSEHDLGLLVLALRYVQAFDAGDFAALEALFLLELGHPDQEEVLCATAEALASEEIEAVRLEPGWQERFQDLVAHWRERG